MNVPHVHGAKSARDSPLVVAYGMGVDSTALLIGLHRRGIQPDLILFADTGGEKPDTYLYAPIFRQWPRDVDFPQGGALRFAPYDSRYGECHKNHTLPGIAFRKKSCSIKWKMGFTAPSRWGLGTGTGLLGRRRPRPQADRF